MISNPEFELRAARREEYPFVEALYMDAIRPLMSNLECWNEDQRQAAFRRSYKTSEVSIIVLGQTDIGWMQISERDTDFNLAQIQILNEYCGLGIGTRLVTTLLERAERMRKTVSLSAVYTNRAIALYERLGFCIIDPDARPILDMVWEPAQ